MLWILVWELGGGKNLGVPVQIDFVVGIFCDVRAGTGNIGDLILLFGKSSSIFANFLFAQHCLLLHWNDWDTILWTNHYENECVWSTNTEQGT